MEDVTHEQQTDTAREQENPAKCVLVVADPYDKAVSWRHRALQSNRSELWRRGTSLHAR